MGQCRLLSGIQLCERCCEQAEAARCAEQQSTHLTRGVGFASLVHVPSPKLSTYPSLSLSSGPAGDSSDTCGSAYAHPGASANRHVHAGEVSQTVGTEGMLGGEPWHPTWCASGGGRHLLCLLLYWTVVSKLFPCSWLVRNAVRSLMEKHGSVLVEGQGSWQFWWESV